MFRSITLTLSGEPAAAQGFAPIWDERTSPAAWIHQTVMEWTALTGECPSPGTVADTLLREKVLNGVPGGVQSQMKENPIITTSTLTTWINFLTQYMDNHKKKTETQSKTAAAMAHTLARLQLQQLQAGNKKG